MLIENLARRLVRLDSLIALLKTRDPGYVERHLLPARERAWRTFRDKFSSSCTSADLHQIVELLTGRCL